MHNFRLGSAIFILLVCSVFFVVSACSNAGKTSARDRSAADQSAADSKNLEQALIVYLVLSDNKFGTSEEREALFKLQDKLTKIVEDKGLGLFDGNDFGAGECTFYMYGPSADALEKSVIPAVKAFGPRKGSSYLKRYGNVEDENVKEIRVNL